MTTKFANITETRTKMTALTKQAQKNGLVILLKNGKPLLGLLDYKEVEEYQKWKEEQKKLKEFQQWADSLPEEKITKEQAISIAKAQEDKGVFMTAEEFKKR